MSEPDVASSDPTNLQTEVRREGGELVINGRKWFISGAAHPNCRLLIVMCRNGDEEAHEGQHAGHSMVLVPMDTPGVKVVRNIAIMQHHSPEGHCEIMLRDVRVPVANLLGGWGEAFAMAQARLGPGRIHHCMRTIGQCELALELACDRALERRAFGKYLADQANVQDWIAQSRLEIDQARLLVLRAAWSLDQAERSTRFRSDIAAIKVVAGAAADARGGPGDADLRRHGHVARHAAGVAVDLGPCAALHGRAGRGPPAHRRAPGAGPREGARRFVVGVLHDARADGRAAANPVDSFSFLISQGDTRRCWRLGHAAMTSPGLNVRPLTPARWPDLETVFNARGCSVARGCWCMYYRVSGKGGLTRPGETRRTRSKDALRRLARDDPPPGLIGYRGRTPVGWISLGPRQDYAKLEKSPVMKPVDDEPVWSVVCFVVPSEYRHQGVARQLLAGAVEYARKRGVRLLEAYPVDKAAAPGSESSWFGSKAMFDEAGFGEVARRKPARPVVRLLLSPDGKG